MSRVEGRALRRRIRLGLIIGSLTALAPLSIDLYLPALPDLTKAFDSTASQGQLTLTACLVGLALGQVVAGPLSDRLGRRRPLLAGLAGYCGASIACALAPSLEALISLRFLQGFAGASGFVISRAIVRDLRAGAAAARVFSFLMLVTGLAPILAPLLGAQLLRVTSWRGLFVALAVVGFLMLLAVAILLEETLPSARRRSDSMRDTLSTFWRLLGDRTFVGYTLVISAGFGQLLAYIAGSSFVIQDIYDVSPQLYGAIFAVNAVGLVAAGQANAVLVGSMGPRRLLSVGIVASASAGICLVAVVLVGGIGLAGILPCLFVVVASIGLVGPNATALALTDHPREAGSASALLGVIQFLVGAAVAPLAGIAGSESAVPMAVLIAALGLGGIGALALSRSPRIRGTRPVPEPTAGGGS
jgi:DHA1 family bicyclomycin/chloramphenicol resistance-like MFS transporter